MARESQKTPLIRLLPESEWGLLAAAREATRTDEPMPREGKSLVVVAEDAGRVVGSITAERVWCVSNFYAERAYRGTGLAGEMAARIAAMNAEGLTEVLVTTSRHVELLAFNMGFTPAEGVLWRR